METVLALVNAIPTQPLPKGQFHAYGEQHLKGWKQTHSQIARQMALYYEDWEGICHPRFTRKVSIETILKYTWDWAHQYFVPNPFTPSLKNDEFQPTNIYAYIKSEILKGNTSFSKACNDMFGIELNNTDKVRVYLNNFTDIIISDDGMSLNASLCVTDEYSVHPDIDIKTDEEYFSYFKTLDESGIKEPIIPISLALQQIFYGAPGTGKSNMTNLVTAKHPGSIRTTFHPDSDYSTFVGAYKPTMEMVDICDEKGQTMKIGEVTLRKEQITYKFVKQAFLKAYIQAWKLYQQTAVEGQEVKPQFLVIEEINRGNCAQIFGDLFQLLDRKNGFSEYPIEADEDIRKCLLQKDTAEDTNFGEHGLNLSDEQKAYIDSIFDPKDGTKRHVADKICQGQVLVLPPNLYIWATMNTSDQSLFPIDSAFKRRWDWKYMRITNHTEMAWRIKFDYLDNGEVQHEDRDWWEFLYSINKHIKHATHSEDKQLGYFFCKANNDKAITAETFVGKVIFYLWNDVFKTSGYKKTVFQDMDFDKFYLDNAESTEDNPDGLNKLLVHKFIENVIQTAQEL